MKTSKLKKLNKISPRLARVSKPLEAKLKKKEKEDIFIESITNELEEILDDKGLQEFCEETERWIDIFPFDYSYTYPSPSFGKRFGLGYIDKNWGENLENFSKEFLSLDDEKILYGTFSFFIINESGMWYPSVKMQLTKNDNQRFNKIIYLRDLYNEGRRDKTDEWLKYEKPLKEGYISRALDFALKEEINRMTKLE